MSFVIIHYASGLEPGFEALRILSRCIIVESDGDGDSCSTTTMDD